MLGIVAVGKRCRGLTLKLVRTLFLIVSTVFGYCSPALADSIVYSYDELGRLKSVTDGSGETAAYVYDSLGNIIAIRRTPAGNVVITEFTPDTADIGSSVRIFGAGFSATPAANTVQFNGATGVVTQASTNSLTVTVPSGATTGRISVTSPLGTAMSATDFVVAGLPGAPSITGFTPQIGPVGTVVTINGTNFDSAIATKVAFNGSFASIASISATTIQVAVPANASSGKIQVYTPRGSAISADDFIVPPPGISTADIESWARLPVSGTPQPVSVGTANKVALLLFSGTQGGLLTIDLPTLTVTPSANLPYEIYAPGNRLALSGSLPGPKSIHVPPLPATGAYALYLKPGSSTFNGTIALRSDSVITDTTLATSTSFSAQTRRFAFEAPIWAWSTIWVNNYSFTGPITGATVFMPDGVTPGPGFAGCGSTECVVNVDNWPQPSGYSPSGKFLVVVDPGHVGSFNVVHISNATASVSVGGAVQTLAVSKPGQRGSATYTPPVNQNVGIGLSWTSLAPSTSVQVRVAQPTPAGGLVNSSGASGYSEANCDPSLGMCSIYVPAWWVAGKAFMELDPNQKGVGNIAITASTDKISTIALDGAEATIDITRVGQIGRMTFTGTSGQIIGIQGRVNSLSPPSWGAVNFEVHGPLPGDGSVGGVQCSVAPSSTCVGFSNPLPSTGTYSVRIDRSTVGQPGNFGALISSDVAGGTLTVDGAPTLVSLTRPAQTVRLTFTATAGQRVGLNLTNISLIPSSSNGISVSIYQPNGMLMGGWGCYPSGSSCGFNIGWQPLPASGQYSVLVQDYWGRTGSFNMSVFNQAGGTLSVDGGVVNTTITKPWQRAYFTFNGTAGQNLAFGIRPLTLSPATTATATTYDPLLAQLETASCTTANGGCTLQLANPLPNQFGPLPSTGLYTVELDPAGSTGTLSAAVSTDLTGTLPLSVDVPVSVTPVGRNGRYTFAGTAGQTRKIRISSQATTPSAGTVGYYILDPTGSLQQAFLNDKSTQTLTFTTAGTGTYTLVVYPLYARTATMTLKRTQ